MITKVSGIGLPLSQLAEVLAIERSARCFGLDCPTRVVDNGIGVDFELEAPRGLPAELEARVAHLREQHGPIAITHDRLGSLRK